MLKTALNRATDIEAGQGFSPADLRVCRPAKDQSVPAVVLLHGFASHADEVGGFFVRLAEGLAGAGIASLRFTFAGFDRPPEARIDSSIGGMVEEAEAAWGFLAADARIDPTRIGLLGFSLGGAAAVLTAARGPERWRSLATWSCGAGLEARFRRMAGDAAFDAVRPDEPVRLDLGWRKIVLNAGFFQSLAGCVPEEEIRRWSGPFLAIAGGEDDLSEYLAVFHANAGGRVKEKLLIPGADHIFNILDDPERFANGVIRRTVDWFERTLGG